MERSSLGACRGAIIALGFGLLAAIPRPGAAITVNSAADIKKADKECTLREAVQVAFDLSIGSTASFPECKTGAGKDVIDFTSGLGTIEIANMNDPIFLSSQLKISGPATISGGKRSRIFVLGGSVAIRLEKLILKDALGDAQGGAILISSSSNSLTIVRCEFRGNRSPQDGGAIQNSGSDVTIEKSTFAGNTAKWSGGALSGSGPWKITDSEFNGNGATLGGGAISCGSNSLTIAYSSFIANSASGGGEAGASGGGAIMSNCDNSIKLTLFESNNALGKVGGGALFMGSFATGTVQQSVFRTNSTGWDSAGGSGGAMNVEGAILIDQSAFNQNYAAKGNGGGAIFFRNSTSQVVNSVFVGNVSTFDSEMVLGIPPADPWVGAAIAAHKNSYVEIVNSSLINNQGLDELSYSSGGSLPGAGITLKNTIIEGWLCRRTCGGDLTQIYNGDDGVGGKNLQSEGTKGERGLFEHGEPTCLDVAKGNSGSAIEPGDFGPALPAGALAFKYPRPAPNGGAAGKGDSAVCSGGLVNFLDLLDELRPDLCALGAVEP